MPGSFLYPVVVLGAWTAVVFVGPYVMHYYNLPGSREVSEVAAMQAYRALSRGVGRGLINTAGTEQWNAVWKVVEHLLLGSAAVILRVPA